MSRDPFTYHEAIRILFDDIAIPAALLRCGDWQYEYMNAAYRAALQTRNDPPLAAVRLPDELIRATLSAVCASGMPRQLVGVPVARKGDHKGDHDGDHDGNHDGDQKGDHNGDERLYAIHVHPFKHRERAESVLLLALEFDGEAQRKHADSSARIEQMYARQQALADAIIAITREPSIRAALSEITERARELIGAHQAVTSLRLGQSVNQAVNAISLSDKYAEWRSYDAPPDGTGISAMVYESNQPVRMTQAELESHERWQGEGNAGRPPLRGWLAAPLVDREGKSIGVIQLSDRYQGEFTADDQVLLVELAQFASVAVENARLFDMAKAAHREAELANRAKDEFLAAVSHELRTPLNTIIGWTQMLLDDNLSETQRRRAIEVIDRNARAQARLIEDILDVSRIISGKLRLSVAPVDLVEVIHGVLDTIQPAAAAKHITMSTVLDSEAGLIAGDTTRLNQVISNLLMNAVKFTARGGRIQVELSPIDSLVELRVIDNGQGITAELLPHIFERFRQAEDSATTRQHGGLGLGLSIVRHIVELHGGTVEAHSDGAGQGSSFIVRLPLSPVRKRSRSTLVTDGNAEADEPRCPDIIEGLHVLVVDDDMDARELLASVFARCGAQVTTAESTLAAMAWLQRGTFDVMLADIGLPDLDGYELIRRVRALPASKGGQVPAVALTAHARLEDRTRALLAGFDIHVTKPIEPRELLAVVASVVTRYRSILHSF
jgi:signal transduction histidine kinase/ActR/RegA family two-component response regulator